jgi:hypothetical protein
MTYRQLRDFGDKADIHDRTMSFEMVTVRVGEADVAVDIPVYRDQLSAVSLYFRGAFEGPFKEATDRILPLTDVSEQTFRIFLQWTHFQANSQSSAASMRTHDAVLQALMTKLRDETTTIPGIDEKGYHDERKKNDSRWTNPESVVDCQLMRASFLRLYVFADKYDIPQFRDDILTALIAQPHVWKWPSSPDQDLIEHAYANLPQSSKFIRFLVLSVATWYIWDSSYEDATRLLCDLKETHKDFALEVAILQVEIYRDKVFPNKHGASSQRELTLPHSCILHEHRVQDKKQCRERIRNHPYIFNILIDACLQDALGMEERCNEA